MPKEFKRGYPWPSGIERKRRQVEAAIGNWEDTLVLLKKRLPNLEEQQKNSDISLLKDFWNLRRQIQMGADSSVLRDFEKTVDEKDPEFWKRYKEALQLIALWTEKPIP